MLGSRVCWQLLLGWALLLGQPVSGDSDAAEEPPLAESEDVVPISQEPEEPVPEPQEPEEPVPEPQEPEEPVSELQEPEKRLLEVSEETFKNLQGRPLSSEEMQLFLGPSDKELEEQAKEYREELERDHDSPFSHRIESMKQHALWHYNQKSNYVYTLYENGNVKIKKAIGTMIYIKLLLVKTSCTKEEGEALAKQLLYGNDDDDNNDDEMVHNSLPKEKKRCQIPPASEQEIEECTFTMFWDARKRSWGNYKVTDMECVPVKQNENNY